MLVGGEIGMTVVKGIVELSRASWVNARNTINANIFANDNYDLVAMAA